MADDQDSDCGGGHIPGSDGGESHELPVILRSKVVPLNSRRLIAAHLKQVADALELTTTGAADQLSQLIEGKLSPRGMSK